jgi:hypothetical protein
MVQNFHSPSQKTTRDWGRKNQWEASELLFLLAKPDFYSHLASGYPHPYYIVNRVSLYKLIVLMNWVNIYNIIMLVFGYCFTPRHRSILWAAGHNIVTPANQLMVMGLKIWSLSNPGSNQGLSDHWTNALTNCTNQWPKARHLNWVRAHRVECAMISWRSL